MDQARASELEHYRCKESAINLARTKQLEEENHKLKESMVAMQLELQQMKTLLIQVYSGNCSVEGGEVAHHIIANSDQHESLSSFPDFPDKLTL